MLHGMVTRLAKGWRRARVGSTSQADRQRSRLQVRRLEAREALSTLHPFIGPLQYPSGSGTFAISGGQGGSGGSGIRPAIGGGTVTYWTDATKDGKWTTAGNWSAGLPSTTLGAVFDSTRSPNGNDSCTIPGGASITVYSVKFQAYTSTLSIGSPLTIKSSLTSSQPVSIVQPNGVTSSAITVSGTMTWTAGTINSTGALSQLTLTTCSATFGGAGTACGDNIDLYDSGVTVTGGLTMYNAAGITTHDSSCGFTLSGSTNLSASGTAIGTITNNGGGASAQSIALPYINNSASATLKIPSGTLNFTGAPASGGASVTQQAGVIDLGGTMGAAFGYTQNGGTFNALGTAGDTITGGPVLITGGVVAIDPGDTLTTGSLLCTGLVTMDGGTFQFSIDAGSSQADVWKSNTGFAIGGTATFSETTIHVPGGGVPTGQSWIFMDSSAAGVNTLSGAFNPGTFTPSVFTNGLNNARDQYVAKS